LEIQQRFEPPLRDLGLVRRVRRVPARVLEDVALDNRRRNAVVIAEAEIRTEYTVGGRDLSEAIQRLVLGPLRVDRKRPPKADRLGPRR
jgi:hypothetical protein